MSRVLRRLIGLVGLVIIVGSLGIIAGKAYGYGEITPVLIEKDKHGRLTEESVARFAEALEEIREHEVLRCWVVADSKDSDLMPGDPGYERAAARLRALQEKIVANLGRVMREILPGEEYPTVGPYVAVTINEAGANALAVDRNVQSFAVLVPRY